MKTGKEKKVSKEMAVAIQKKPLIFIPTYNELENAELLCKAILELKLDCDILFMDDGSPDGTGELIDRLSQAHPNVKAIHRKGKLGIGSAHYDGIQWAYSHGYETLVTMDCDFTHPPKYIPEVLKNAEGYDIVVGSRYLQKKSLSEWNLFRKLLTLTGHTLTRLLLKMPYDATGAFRLYRLNRIPRHAFDLINSKGYSFFFESLFLFCRNKFKIKEIPIVLPARTYGHSKMDIREVFKSVRLLFSTYFTTLVNQERYKVYHQVSSEQIDASKQDPQNWDEYWKDQKSSGGFLYDIIAAFYRKFIIKRTLNYFVHKYFKGSSEVLHAGCGSGQVDTDIRNYINITGLDISVNALNFYKRTNEDRCKVLHGSIFSIPLPDNSVDGIYNLGVMEHFTEAEIYQILKEFHRVLKPKGRMLIFWPPEFGASVIFLKMVKWVLENIFKKENVKLHPDEITRVQSKKQVCDIFQSSGFHVLNYYFGLRDFCTYSIIAVEKVEMGTVPVRHNTSSQQVHLQTT
jgi:dolichol-phosphate mannosyltransferase